MPRRGPLAMIRARRGRPAEQRVRRLANSIRLPWATGLTLLVLVGGAVAVLLGRQSTGPADVPSVVVDDQRQLTSATAQNVRRSLNESIADLRGLAQVVRLLGPAESDRSGADVGMALDRRLALRETLVAFMAEHGRYSGMAFLDESGRPVISAGSARILPELLAPDATFVDAEIRRAVGTPGETPIIQEGVPLPDKPFGLVSVVARYDPSFLRFPLQTAEPGAAWIVDRDGRIVGGLEPATFRPLPRPELVEAGRRSARGTIGAVATGTSLDRQTVIAYAPVSGFGPAGVLGWSVVTSRGVSSFALPQADIRRQALLAGLAIVTFTLLIFGWLYITVIRPITRLQTEAERIAFGDLSRAVEVIRYDEIGIVARALERIRVLLIRRRAETPPK